MKVLSVSSGNSGEVTSFVKEQGNSLIQKGVDVEYFLIKGKGIIGYLRNLSRLKNIIKKNNYNIIHAHYGLSGLLCVLQRKAPVIITFHGSDVNNSYANFFSKIAFRFSRFNVFVSEKLVRKSKIKKRFITIPCGINSDLFYPMEKANARRLINLDPDKKYVLFSSSFDNPVKNYLLAKEALALVKDAELIEFKGFNRDQCRYLLNAADAVLMTSITEGSPQVIKESMACNCPIVSVDVGDVKDILGDVEGCHIAKYDAKDIADKINLVLKKNNRTNGELFISHFNNNLIAEKLIKVYQFVLGKTQSLILEEKTCSRCIMDTTDPVISFDEQGVCQYCHMQAELEKQYPLDEAGKKAIDNIVQAIKARGKNKKYDCIIGISGGTDSTYQLYLAKKLNLRPLVVHLDNGWDSEIAVNNIQKATSKLGFDLYTYVIDWEEFRDIQLSFLKSSTPDSEVPTDLAIQSILYKVADQEGIKYIMNGHSFRTEGKVPVFWSYGDGKYLKAVQKQFGSIKIKSFPNYTIRDVFYYSYIKRIKQVRLLYYFSYNKPEIKELLKKELDWQDYGGHHYESIYTRFYQGYILPRKFNIDKRKRELSALIRSNIISKEKALHILKTEPPMPKNIAMADRSYVIKKLGITEEEFERIMNNKPKTFLDYPNYLKTIMKYRRIIKFLYKYTTTTTPLILEKGISVKV